MPEWPHLPGSISSLVTNPQTGRSEFSVRSPGTKARIHQKDIAMKILIAFLAAPLALCLASTANAAPPAAKPIAPALASPQLQIPSAEAMTIMIRSSLVALNQANMTGNYTVLSAIGSPAFHQANSPERLAQIFQSFRANAIDLAPVTLLPSQLTQAPRIENGRLRLIGVFPTQPLQVSYDLMFEPVAGQWRLFGLSVNLPKATQLPVGSR
jgi:hypothetical protein